MYEKAVKTLGTVPYDNMSLNVMDYLLRTGNITEYGKDRIGFNLLQTPQEVAIANEVGDEGDIIMYADKRLQFRLRALKHVKYVLEHPQMVLKAFNSRKEDFQLVTKHSGLIVKWTYSHASNLFRIGSGDLLDAVAKSYDGFTIERDEYDNRVRLLFPANVVGKLTTSWTTSNANELIIKSLWHARLTKVHQAIRYTDYFSSIGDLEVGLRGVSTRNTFAPLHLISELRSVLDALSSAPTKEEFAEARATVLHQIARRVERNSANAIDSKSFDVYWDTLKRGKSITVEQAQAQFDTIPLLPVGTASSRTWGIEVETVRADDVSSIPGGWDVHSDGSLEVYEDCSCGCDYCYDGEHQYCGDEGEGCARGNSSAEYVSPILKSFNSRGLRSICDDIPIVYESNSTPGIHVHVGASDLTVVDIARLLQAYSAVSPLLSKVYYRHARGYCKDTTTEQLKYWLKYVRYYRMNHGMLPSTNDAVRNAPGDRYYDVNLEALLKHGTIEFRAMGAVYSYEHLVRWAWVVREMVNVSRLNVPLSAWTSCQTLTDVIAVLQKYGSETSDTQLSEEVEQMAYHLTDA